jgi:tRNA-2-methylthio-N6-dimethylallyladenosine synthase
MCSCRSGYVGTDDPRDADPSSSTLATSAKRRLEKVYLSWVAASAEGAQSRQRKSSDNRRCRLRCPGRGRGDHPPGAGCRYRLRSPELPPPAAPSIASWRKPCRRRNRFSAEEKFAHLSVASPEKTIARGVTAFVTVQEGCDKFCTFASSLICAARNSPRSVADIENEVRRLAGAGVREVTLLGQNVMPTVASRHWVAPVILRISLPICRCSLASKG